jgi:hypothetical protein
MLDRYSIDYAGLAANPEGVFTNGEIQEQFAELAALAAGGEASAYKAGALVEEVDIEDLDAAIAATSQEDLRCVYSNLRAASVKHLQAFVKNLERLGETYEPQVLSQAEIEGLLASGRGNRGKRRAGKMRRQR